MKAQIQSLNLMHHTFAVHFEKYEMLSILKSPLWCPSIGTAESKFWNVVVARRLKKHRLEEVVTVRVPHTQMFVLAQLRQACNNKINDPVVN